MSNVFYYNTKIGKLRIVEDGNRIVGVSVFEGSEPEQIRETELIKTTYLQLQEYFEGKRTTFDIPIRLEGTSFQIKVWEELRKIPYGETRSYGEVATQIGSPKGARAVGGANHHNPILIIVPCHRVIGASGSLVGFGAGIPVKEMLLKIENQAST
ncbi:methylated-DNA--[protein]-cysteine S-methyltransferase [Lachnoclostridium phytofermentans]|jgi:methylated-DNA-[protein]-cysteine S-methyltransferase|uniref:methylated-DNA--[protein]-cysteine S-methyltransferase n=1 Tax=Lachnoclostridium phytofermentans TaxID=66219 RepID=UPI000496E296|nr:methylated-DNA--[protein]-cysteine S-methyltransferase [Lachnoclostridium phytofermentans]